MRKLTLLSLLLLALISCGKTDKIFTPDHIDQINDNTARIEALEKRVKQVEDDAETTSNNLNGEIARLDQADQDNLDLVRDEISSLQDDLEDAIEDLEDSDKKLAKKISKVKKKIKIIQRRLNRFESGQRSLSRSISNLYRFTYRINSNLQSLADTVSGLEEDIEELDEDLEDLEDDVEDNSEDIEDLLEESEESGSVCSVSYRNLHTHYRGRGQYVLYGDIYLTCGNYSKRLENHTQINGDDEDEEEDR